MTNKFPESYTDAEHDVAMDRMLSDMAEPTDCTLEQVGDSMVFKATLPNSPLTPRIDSTDSHPCLIFAYAASGTLGFVMGCVVTWLVIK